MPSHLIRRTWPGSPARVVEARGCRLRTADGRELLDASSGALAVTLGYGVEAIADAVAGQARRLPFAHSGRFTTAVAEDYAAELTAIMPGVVGGGLRRWAFTAGGSESIELAVALAYRTQVARGRPDRSLVIGRHLSYHGATLAALSAGARAGLRGLVTPLLSAVPHLPPPYPYRPEWHERFPAAVAGVPGLEASLTRPLASLEIELARADPAAALEVAIEALGPRHVCAFLAEPIIGASAGAVVPPDAYWAHVRTICDRHDVLLIADEVMTGMGRTGAWLASDHWNLVPDFVALGKGMGNGAVPLGGVGMREEHWQRVAKTEPGFPLGQTFSQHPVAAAAGRAALAHARAIDAPALATALGERLLGALTDGLGEHPRVGDVRGRGALLAVEIVADRDSRAPYPRTTDATGLALRAAEARDGVLFYPARGGADGVRGDAFLVAPPLIATDRDCDRIVQACVTALDALPPPR